MFAKPAKGTQNSYTSESPSTSEAVLKMVTVSLTHKKGIGGYKKTGVELTIFVGVIYETKASYPSG